MAVIIPHPSHMAGSCAWLLEQLAHSLRQPGWAKRNLSSKYLGTVLWLLIAAPHHRGADKEAGSHCCISSRCCKPLSLWLKWLMGIYKASALPPPTTIFHFFPFWEPDIEDSDIQKQLHIWGKLESGHTYSGKGSEKIWEDIKFTLQTNSQHRDSLQQSQQYTVTENSKSQRR